jgi:hypothetical protein
VTAALPDYTLIKTSSNSTQWLSVNNEIRVSALHGYITRDDHHGIYVAYIGAGRAQSLESIRSKTSTVACFSSIYEFFDRILERLGTTDDAFIAN